MHVEYRGQYFPYPPPIRNVDKSAVTLVNSRNRSSIRTVFDFVPNGRHSAKTVRTIRTVGDCVKDGRFPVFSPLFYLVGTRPAGVRFADTFVIKCRCVYLSMLRRAGASVFSRDAYNVPHTQQTNAPEKCNTSFRRTYGVR